MHPPGKTRGCSSEGASGGDVEVEVDASDIIIIVMWRMRRVLTDRDGGGDGDFPYFDRPDGGLLAHWGVEVRERGRRTRPDGD